jgi:hypothetical protein
VIPIRFRESASFCCTARSAALFALALALLVTGCRRENIRVYDAPKEKSAPRLAVPDGWEEQPAGQMAVGSYVIRGPGGAKAQVTITALPAAASSKNELANVNRWRGQLGLKEISVDQLNRDREQIQMAGHAAALFDLAGTMDSTPTRILAAMQSRGDAVWFFKMIGSADLVKSQKDAFVQFAAAYPLPHDHDHAEQGQPAATVSPPPQNEAPASAAPAGEARSRWSAPSGWVEQQPGAMQDAKFAVAGGKAVMTISIFENSGGDLRPNVDRWRAQIGLKPATDEEFSKSVTPLDLPEGKATIVDVTGPQQRLVSVIAVRGARSWYFKLVGDPDVITAEKSKLIEFVKTTK